MYCCSDLELNIPVYLLQPLINNSTGRQSTSSAAGCQQTTSQKSKYCIFPDFQKYSNCGNAQVYESVYWRCWYITSTGTRELIPFAKFRIEFPGSDQNSWSRHFGVLKNLQKILLWPRFHELGNCMQWTCRTFTQKFPHPKRS